jgi:hypothetical protein
MANVSTTTGALFISRKTGNADVTEGDLQGYHPESEFLRIQGLGDVGDANGISAAFSMSAGTMGSMDSSPEAKLYIRVSGRSTGVTNAFGLIPDTYMMTLAGSTGNVGIGTTDPQFKLDVTGGIRSTSVTCGTLLSDSINSTFGQIQLTTTNPTLLLTGMTNGNIGNVSVYHITNPQTHALFYYFTALTSGATRAAFTGGNFLYTTTMDTNGNLFLQKNTGGTVTTNWSHTKIRMTTSS